MSNDKIELRSLPLDIEGTQEDGNMHVKGLVNQVGSISELLTNPTNGKQFRETIAQGVFTRALQKGNVVDFYYNHDSNAILATTHNDSLQLQEDERGFVMEADIVDTTWGKNAYNLIQEGVYDYMSFGMQVLDEDWAITSGGDPLRIINDIILFEVSAVRNPAYRASGISVRGLDIVDDVDVPELKELRGTSMTDKKIEAREDDEFVPEENSADDKQALKKQEDDSKSKDASAEEDKDSKPADDSKESDDKTKEEPKDAKAPSKDDEKKDPKADEKRDDDSEEERDDSDEPVDEDRGLTEAQVSDIVERALAPIRDTVEKMKKGSSKTQPAKSDEAKPEKEARSLNSTEINDLQRFIDEL